MALTALKDCDPPETCMTARVRPWVGRTAPMFKGSQSIWLLRMPVMAPCRSGEHHTCPSDHVDSARNSATFGWSAGTPSGWGNPRGSNTLVSAPKCFNKRSASRVSKRL